jgi:hypothetical protein
MAWLEAFDFSKKIGWPEIFSVTISLLAVCIAALSLWNSVKTRREALPDVSVETILEGYDTRAFSEGRLVWYWSLDITNTGGRAVTLRGLSPDTQTWPLVVLGKGYQLLNVRPKIGVYVFDGPKFEELAKGPPIFEQYKPKNMEELGALNIIIPSGESRALPMAFVVQAPKGIADMIHFNARLNFNTGMSHSISKFVRIKPSS